MSNEYWIFEQLNNVEYVTCACFGGENLDTLFITTASTKCTKEEIEKSNGLAGSLFKIDLWTFHEQNRSPQRKCVENSVCEMILSEYGIKGKKENIFGSDYIAGKNEKNNKSIRDFYWMIAFLVCIIAFGTFYLIKNCASCQIYT